MRHKGRHVPLRQSAEGKVHRMGNSVGVSCVCGCLVTGRLMFLTFSYRHVDRTYQDGLLVCALQLDQQYPSLDTVIETCGDQERLINTQSCDVLHRNLKCCNCAKCAVKGPRPLEEPHRAHKSHLHMRTYFTICRSK